MSINLVALHGFFGLPSDWDFFNAEDFHISASPRLCASALNISSLLKSNQKNVLMGYSLGGRLALQIMLKDPSQWDAAILISTHPGLQTEKEKQDRIAHDRAWANKFRKDPWEQLMREWNQQPVFGGRSPLQRYEKDFDREQLAQIFDIWSVGKQEDLREKISNLPMPILWITGERDIKFCAFAKTVSLKNRNSQFWLLPEAYHRAPWEQPDLFKKQVQHFLKGVANGFANND